MGEVGGRLRATRAGKPTLAQIRSWRSPGGGNRARQGAAEEGKSPKCTQAPIKPQTPPEGTETAILWPPFPQDPLEEAQPTQA